MSKPAPKKKAKTFPFNPIQIILNLNGEKSPVKFKLGMLYHPDLEENMPDTTTELPLYTDVAKYPSSLEQAYWKDRIAFFFNESTFKQTMQKIIDADPELANINKAKEDPEKKRKIEKHNIMVMLRCLFPISGKFDKALASSYDQYIRGKANNRILWDVDIPETVNFFGILNKIDALPKEYGVSYIKVDGSPRAIMNVVWQNDLVNHPVYKEFILNYTNSFSALDVQRDTVAQAKTANIKKMQDTLVKHDAKKVIPELTKLWDEVANSYKTTRRSAKVDVLDMCIAKLINIQTNIETVITNVTQTPPVYNTNISAIAEAFKYVFIQVSAYNNENARSPITYGAAKSLMDDLNLQVREYNALEFVSDFVNEPHKLIVFSDKNIDQSPKSPFEMSVLKFIQTDYNMIYNKNSKLLDAINNIYKPKRQSSNSALFELIKSARFGEKTANPTLFEDVYAKYLTNSEDRDTGVSLSKGDIPLLYTGVDYVSVSDDKKDQSQSMEIYVYMNTVLKDAFETTPGSKCINKDDVIDNDIKHYSKSGNYYVVNPERSYRLASKSVKSNTETKTAETKSKTGGRQRRTRRHKRRHTHK